MKAKSFWCTIRNITFKQLAALVVMLCMVNWLSSSGTLRRPWGLFSCQDLTEKMDALYLLGKFTAANFYHIPDRDDVLKLIDDACVKNKLDHYLVYALVEVESGYRFYAVSPKGACGYMQLLPTTAKALNVTEIFDPTQNIDAGTRYLKSLISQFRGDMWLALVAYNWGPTHTEKIGHDFTPAMKHYITKILEARFEYSERQNGAEKGH
jgi:hypothetical protein